MRVLVVVVLLLVLFEGGCAYRRRRNRGGGEMKEKIALLKRYLDHEEKVCVVSFLIILCELF